MQFDDILTCNNVQKQFKNFALDVPELHIPKGFATALVGENGAGKSTLLNILSGIRLDYRGTVHYFGETTDVDSVKHRLGYTGTKNYFSPQWNGAQIREMSGLLFDDFEPERFDQICHAIDIDSSIFSKTGKAVSKLSDGNQTKLMLACVFARKTELLLLDEPASPLDPLMRDTLSDMIRRYIAEGDGSRSVLFSTHNITDMESVTDYVLIMEQGQIVEQGFVLDLKEKYIVVKGDADDTEAARPYLLTCQSNSYGFEGICLADQLDRLAGTHVEVETPSLFQISVAVMKQNSRLTIPDIA